MSECLTLNCATNDDCGFKRQVDGSRLLPKHGVHNRHDPVTYPWLCHIGGLLGATQHRSGSSRNRGAQFRVGESNRIYCDPHMLRPFADVIAWRLMTGYSGMLKGTDSASGGMSSPPQAEHPITDAGDFRTDVPQYLESSKFEVAQ
ncbi:hypothetical protein RSAG8_01307, partial [Rhizoctonia solani AG-8 WAC10335]